MKNKTATFLYGIISLCSAAYYLALKLADFSFVLSFSESLLLLALLFALFFFITKMRPAQDTDHALPSWHRWARITLAAFISVGIAIAVVNLAFICSPKTIDTSMNINDEPKYIIILGGGIKHDRTLGIMPQKRIEKAAAFIKQHPEMKAVVTGGKGRFAPCPEAPVLAAALSSYGIDSTRILQEDKAKDTIQNFLYSATLIALDENSTRTIPEPSVQVKEVLTQPIIIVTSNFHLRRAERLASRIGFTQVYGLSAPTPALFVLNCYCREICSYVKLNLRILLTGKPCKLS